MHSQGVLPGSLHEPARNEAEVCPFWSAVFLLLPTAFPQGLLFAIFAFLISFLRFLCSSVFQRCCRSPRLRLNSCQAAKIFFACPRDRVILRLEVFLLSPPGFSSPAPACRGWLDLAFALQ